jgi:hypothetical protein
MNLQEIIVKPEREPESLHKPNDESDDITLTQFKDDTVIDPHLEELAHQLVGLTSSGQVKAVLSLYLPQFDWGGTEV